MPIDPEISLGINPGSQPLNPGSAFGDPLSTLGRFAMIQNALNQNRLFQQTFTARQRAGQILSTAPDFETGATSLLRDPQTAPFAGEVLNSYRQMQLTLLQAQKTQQEMNVGGYDSAIKGLSSAMLQPGQAFDSSAARGALMSRLQALPASTRSQVAPAFDTLWSSLSHGLPSDPSLAGSEWNKRITALMLGSGQTPETIRGMLGTPGLTDLGGGLVPTMLGPPQAPGIVQTGAGASKTLAPSILPPGPYGEGGATRPTGGVVGGGSGAGFGFGGVSSLGPGPGPGLGIIPPTPPPAGAPNVSALGGRGPSLALPSGPTMSDEEAFKRTGAAAGDIASEMISRGETLPGQLKKLDIMTSALGGFQAGGGASIRAVFGQGLQAMKNAGLPIKQSTIDATANESLSDTQVFQAQIKPFVIGQLKEAAQGTGRVMRSEVDAFLTMMNEAKDPQTLMTLLNQARYSIQVGFDQSQKWAQFKQLRAKKDPSVEGLDQSDFFSWYNSNFNPSKLPSAAGGLALGPVSPESAKGVAPRATKRYNPTTGRIEAIQ